MSKPTIVFVGLGVHKDSISVAYAEEGVRSEPVFIGPIGTRQCDLDKLLRRAPQQGLAAGVRVRGGSLRLRPAALPHLQGSGVSGGRTVANPQKAR